MSRTSNRSKGMAVVLVAALAASACSSGKGSSSPTTRPPTTTPGTAGPGGGSTGDGKVVTGADGQLSLQLSKGTRKATATATPTKVVAGTDLDATAIGAITGRLSPWTDDAALPKDFNWPTQSLPVPRAGRTIEQAFPAADRTPPPAVPAGALEVTRVQPEGAVAVAPFATISFNQPMVPVATIAQLDSAKVPATITPVVPGHWRWIGTQTLRFDADDPKVDRLPMATVFTVTVPAGTTSATGGTLAAAKTFTFSTPPFTLQSMQPTATDSLPLQPVFVASFDQRVDPTALLKSVKLTAGDAVKAVRLATDAEIKADKAIHTEGLLEGRWVAFRAVDPLPTDTAIHVVIAAGAPSAEGPVTTTKPQGGDWHTYAPLAIKSAGCGGSDCAPGSGFQVELNNAIDTAAFDPASVIVTPALPGLVVNVYGTTVVIGGDTKARSSYQVTLPANLTDVFGQQLGSKQVRTVKIAAAEPVLEQFPAPFITIDPLAGKPSVTVGTIDHDNVHVRVFAVDPTQWDTYRRYVVSAQQGPDQQPDLPAWRVLSDRVVDTKGQADQRTETRVDLSDALGGDGLGHVVVLVESTTKYAPNDDRYWANRPTVAWVQGTKLGLDAFADPSSLRVWTTDLTTGAPAAGVTVAAVGSPATATTGTDGVARLGLDQGTIAAVTATSGNDVALLGRDVFQDPWGRQTLTDQAVWYVVDDRHTYRPGETVSVKGFVRRVEPEGAARLHAPKSGPVHYVVNDAQGIQIAAGDATLNPLGGFDFTFAVPDGAKQGVANVVLTAAELAPDAGTTHAFAVQQFRRPEFAVTTSTDGDAPIVSSHPATVGVDATYYAGGPLGAAPVDWAVTTTSASYSPPGWTEYTFGVWTPWWFAGDVKVAAGRGAGVAAGGGAAVDSGPIGPVGPTPTDVQHFTGTTDADGHHDLQVDFTGTKGVLPDLPVSVRAEASVTDVNRQVIASSTAMLVHPADYYVGLRSGQSFVTLGDPISVDVVATSIDGKVAPGRAVHVTASRSEWTLVNGSYVEKPVDTQTCDTTSAAQPVSCSFPTKIGGTYTVTATIADDHGAHSRSEITRWVSGGEARPDRTVAQQELTVVPASQDNRPGGTAEVLVQAPFPTGHGIVTVRHATIATTQTFDVANGSAIVRIPLNEADVPSVELGFEVVGTTTRTGDDGKPLAGAPDRPAYAVGTVTLPVSTASRALTVKATPDATALAPGQKTSVAVAVTGPDGKPVAGAELAVAVVDEAVLALGGTTWPDPRTVFYASSPAFADATYGRASVILAAPREATGQSKSGASTTAAAAASVPPGAKTAAGAAPTAAADTQARSFGGAGSTSTAPVDTRTNFDALAVFQPSVATGADGTARVDLTLPDNLTRYRVMVVAVQGDDRFGASDAEITARKPLMVRPSAPRFANFGDAFALPVVVQNQTDQAMSVDLALQTSNLTVTGAAGRRVDVPAHDRVEVRFAVAAAAAGTARFRVAAVSGELSDATTIELPVYTPVTTEAFATYGVVDDGAVAQPVLAPTNVIGQFGGLDVTTSSTALQGLTDAVLTIVQDRFDSTETSASRILAITSLRDVLAAFDATKLPSKATLDAAVTTDIANVAAHQNPDGGFFFWERGRDSDPYVTVEATHALVVAKAAGFAVGDAVLTQALAYVATIEQHLPAGYDAVVRDTLVAYSLRVRALAGDRDTTKADQLWSSRGGQLGVDALAWLWPEVSDPKAGADIARRIGNAAVDTAGAVTFTTSYGDAKYLILQSDRRVDAVVLDALISQQPTDPLIPKVVAGLLGHRTGDSWASSQESSFVLIALKKYFDTYEKQTPDFVARVWLGDRYAGDQQFQGRSTDRLAVHVPTAAVVAAGNSSVVVQKEGTGRLYYRIGMSYAPSDMQSAALDRGFTVQRTYEAVDDPKDVTLDANGVWHIKAGANVRVKLTMVAESQRTHVALIDPLPAGLEIVNPTLATSPTISPTTTDPTPGQPVPVDSLRIWYPTWFEHQNLKDDRAEAFSNLLPAGTYDYSYVARATTPGTFVTPPTKASEIYEPETFGRSASTKVVVEG